MQSQDHFIKGENEDWRTDIPRDVFRFKQFDILQRQSTMKVNTDAVLLGGWSDVSHARRALDVGTGTGVIALMLAQRNPEMVTWGIDIDEAAAQEADWNMQHSPFASRLVSRHVALQDFAVTEQETFDLIVTNPPFFSGGTFSSNENKANVRHTIKLSHRDLLHAVRKLLHPKGHLDIILPYIEGLRFLEMATGYGFTPVRMTEVRPREDKPIERLLLRLGQETHISCETTMLVMHNPELPYGYSSAFAELTKEFYLFL